MKDVTNRVDDIKETVKGTLGGYKAERKEAAGYWARLKGKEAAVVEKTEEEAPKRKRGRRKK